MEKIDNDSEQQNGSNESVWDSFSYGGSFNKDAAAQARAEAISEELKKRGEEVPKGKYEMELVNFFSSDGASIDKAAWEEVFDRVWKNQDDEKSLRYHDKVEAAIDEWNNAPLEERRDFLDTGEPIEGVSSDSISVLTSARVIAFPKKSPGSGRGPGGGTGEPGPGEPDPGEPFEPGETDDIGSGDEKGPGMMIPRTPFWKRMFGKKRIRSNFPKPEKPDMGSIDERGGIEVPGGEQPIPEVPIEKPPVEELPEEVPEEPESEPIEEEKYEIIKDVYEEELPPNEREEVEKAVQAKRDALKSGLRRGALLALTSLFFIKPPIDTEIINKKAIVDTETTRVENSIEKKTTHIDDQIEKYTVTKESDPDKYRELLLEHFMSETHLGDEVELGKGTAYWESPDHDFGGADKHGEISEKGIRREGKYKADRVVVLSKNGKYLGNYYVGRGDSGSFKELVDQATKDYDGKFTVHLHFNDPTTGWSEDIILGSNFNPGGPESFEEERVIPGHDETTTEVVSRKVEMKAHGETDKLGEDGLVGIVSDDGTVSKINIMHEDGSYYQPGEKVVDSDGRVHTIGDIEVFGGGVNKRINWKNVAWDAAMLGIAGTGLFLALRKKKGEDESDSTVDEGTETEGGEGTIPPEVVTRREMMELNAGQFIRLTDAFDELAGDRADEIANKMAEYAEIEVKPDDVVPQDSIFANMNEQSRTVAKALLEKRDEATLRHLSDLLGIGLDDLVERIMQEPENITGEEV